jgi:uroporphyrinogen-III synthase
LPGVLDGRRILVTRRPEQSAALTAGLLALGAEVVEVPLLELAPPKDVEPLAKALAELENVHWLVLTSANAVRAFSDALARAGRALPPSVRVASVGPATSDAIRELLGIEPALEPPSDFRAAGLLRGFQPFELIGRRVLLPVSERARDVLADGLRARGARVDVVVAYRTVTPAGAGEGLDRALQAGADLVTLASPSAVEGLVGALKDRAARLGVAVIGPVTEHAARVAGLDVRVVASPATAPGLVEAIRRHFAPHRP